MNRVVWGRAFGVVLALAGLTWLVAGAGMTFFSDEWAFIESRSLTDPIGWFRPHNEHWSTLPIILYRLMVETIGISSYMPYLAVVVALHLGVAAMVYRLVERRSGGPWAFLAGTLVAFLGAGFENVFWGFQTGIVGSVLLGLIALDVTDRGPSLQRGWIVAGVLILSLMASGSGLAMCVVVGVAWLIDPGWRKYVGILALPATVYAAWLAAFGREGVSALRNPLTIGAATDVPAFLVEGFGGAAASITGLTSILGILAAGALIGWAASRAIRGTLPPLAGGALAAIAVQYSLIGLVRGGVIDGQVHYTRYTYVAAVLLVLALSSLAGRPRRHPSMPVRAGATAAVVSLVGLAFVYNGTLLVQGRSLFLDRADMTRALLIAGLKRPLPPETDPDRTLVLVPSPNELERITAGYGDARTDVLVPFAIPPVSTSVQVEAARRVREGAEVPLP